MGKEILGIIPARGNSKGVPRKNISFLGGIPLIQYTINAAVNSKLITRLILSSDDQEIMTYCQKQKVDVPFIRPQNLAEDDTSMLAVIKHAALFLKEKEKYVPDLIILLQPTSPFRTTQHIDEALEALMASGADSVVSVVDVPHSFNPYSVMQLEGKHLKPFLKFNETNNIRQKKPLFYGRNGPAVLAFTNECLCVKNSTYGEKILAYVMKKQESIDIDDEFDFNFAKYILEK